MQTICDSQTTLEWGLHGASEAAIEQVSLMSDSSHDILNKVYIIILS